MSRDSQNKCLGVNQSERKIGLVSGTGLSVNGVSAMCRNAGKQMPAAPRASVRKPVEDRPQTSARTADGTAVVWAGGWHTDYARHRREARPVHALPGTAWAALVLSKFGCC